MWPNDNGLWIQRPKKIAGAASAIAKPSLGCDTSLLLSFFTVTVKGMMRWPLLLMPAHAALLSGANHYYALDIVPYANTARNILIPHCCTPRVVRRRTAAGEGRTVVRHGGRVGETLPAPVLLRDGSHQPAQVGPLEKSKE